MLSGNKKQSAQARIATKPKNGIYLSRFQRTNKK